WSAHERGDGVQDLLQTVAEFVQVGGTGADFFSQERIDTLYVVDRLRDCFIESLERLEVRVSENGLDLAFRQRGWLPLGRCGSGLLGPDDVLEFHPPQAWRLGER